MNGLTMSQYGYTTAEGFSEGKNMSRDRPRKGYTRS